MSLTSWSTIVFAAAALTSCEGSTNAMQSFDVVFRVESDPGVRLGGARVFVDGESIGETRSDGLLGAELYGRSGQRLRIEHDCPEGYEAPSQPKLLRLRSFHGIDASGSLAMEITLRCRPEKRLAAFIVRAKNGPGIPVLLDGERVARTNGFGVAHFSAWGAAGTELTVQFDTSAQPELRPQLQTRLFTLPDADEIFVIDQSFAPVEQHRKSKRRRTKITKIE